MKYLYLDDEDVQQTKDIIELLMSECEDLEVKWAEPKSFGDEIKRLKSEEYDGLIFDLRLDQKSDAEYRAFTLAQEIRTRATEGSMKDIPIVVCSTDRKLKESYNKDSSGQDLFDRKYLKTDDLVENSEVVAKELFSLAKGYIAIRNTRSGFKGNSAQKLDEFLSLKASEVEFLDSRFLDYFGNQRGHLPIHEYARFFLKELILKPGILIDEKILCARLGVSEDSEDYASLIDKFKTYKYKGPFSDCWERWWWPLLNNWFKEKTKENLSFLNAAERVEFIKKMTKLDKLIPAKPLERSYSTKYWTICQLYKKPLDPYLDGVILEDNDDPLPWQEKKYMSLKASIDLNSKVLGLNPDPVEKERIKTYKKLKSNG
ncbi:hypothetical protein [Winogradskyella sp. MIT101101]|uniref:hypothetical protein n=1 Tax=Winogradskyella sp. MIT101101 TaxID=3098297 RepID=UPI00399B5581